MFFVTPTRFEAWMNYLEALLIAQGGRMSEVQDTVNAITAQIRKGTGEVLAKVADLEAQIAAGQAPDLTELKAAAQALDDVIPDPEPPAEEPATEG